MRAVHLATVVAGTILAACTKVSSTPSSARIVLLPSDSLEISRVRADMVDGDTVVRGHVARRALLGGPIPGYLQVEAVSGSSVVAWSNTRWSTLARRRLPVSTFQARLPDTARSIDEIRVAHVSVGLGGTPRSGTPQ